MSLDLTQKQIRCDNADCGERLTLPITTQSSPRTNSSNASGWAFVASIYEDRHYCPNCARDRSSVVLARRA